VLEVAFQLTDLQIRNIVQKLLNLRSAIIDASSVIYLDQIGILKTILKSYSIVTIRQILEEISQERITIAIINNHQLDYLNLENDELLVQYACQYQLPVISEDKQILKNAERIGLDYYNSLMVLNRLLLEKIITKSDFQLFYADLLQIARYSKWVINYNQKIIDYIIDI
jgi:hypothetical protein